MTEKAYEVKLKLPGQEPVTIHVASAADNLDAKAKASKDYYGAVYTGQFRFMAARIKRG